MANGTYYNDGSGWKPTHSRPPLRRPVANFGENANGITPDGRVIDLAKYGITAVDYEPPFTEEMYHVAHANGVGIQKAIDDAKSAGMTDAVLPAGRYPVCYHASADDERNPIINIKGVNLFAAGVTLYVVYDEEGNNPYFTGETPRLLQGSVIETDSDVYGLHCIGERPYRVENAQYREFSSGIELNAGCNGNTIDNCICEYFSGDGFGAGQYITQAGLWEDTLTAVAWNGTEFVFDEYKYTSPRHGADFLDQTRPCKLKAQGYTYALWTYAPIKIHCFSEAEAYIGTVSFWQGEYFYFLPGTHYWYYELRYGAAHAEDSTVDYNVCIGYGYYSGTVLKNCISRYNTRGGMSNLPNNAHLIDCTMHHNGCAWEGMPGFYDGTQFGFDQEDIYINQITLERCNVYGNLNGILWRCRNIKFIDCTIQGVTKCLNSCGGFHAEHTKFLGGVVLEYSAQFGRKIAIGCEFAGTVPKEIVVLDDVAKIPASAVLIGDKRSVLELRNAAGETVMSVDLTYLGKRLGEEIVQDMLMFDIDLANVSPDALTFDDKTGAVSVEVKSADTIVAHGIRADKFNIPVTWKNDPVFGDSYSVEMVTFGRLQHGLSLSAANYTPVITCLAQSGYEMPVNAAGNAFISTGSNAPYAKADGASAKASGYVGYNLIDDYGAAVTGNDVNIPYLESMTLTHIIANFYSDGRIEMICNGYPAEQNPTTTDFAAWDMSKFAPSFMLWHTNFPDDERIIRAARMYNRPLSKEEARNNFAYELNRLGDVRRIIVTATNCTVDNRPVVNGYGKPYTATVTANDGYTLEGATVSVVMGTEDITETAYADGAINIEAMTGDVTITVTAATVATE